MYKPTVRMNDIFREYVNDLFHATDLDRNQIIRMLVMTAPASKIFYSKINAHLKPDTQLPDEPWKMHEDNLWQEIGEEKE